MPRKNSGEVGGTSIGAKHRKLVWFIASAIIRHLIRMKHYPKGFTGIQGIHLYTIPALEQMRSMQLFTKRSVLQRYVIQAVT